MESDGPVVLTREKDVAYITLNSPPVNILSAGMMKGISNALQEIAGDDSLKAVVFKAVGKLPGKGISEEFLKEQGYF